MALWARREIQVRLWRANAAVCRMNMSSCLCTERDPRVLGVRAQQCCRMNMSDCARSQIQVCSGRENAAVFTCLPAHGEGSKCVHSVRMQQCCRLNMSVCAQSEIQVCSRRARGVRTQQSFCRNMSFCSRREIQVCLWRASAAVLSHEHLFVPCVRMEIQVAGVSRVLAQQLP